MRVKRYVVDSMPDALQKIRSELGSDAVILSTKDIRSGGFLGMFGKKRIEVVAATDASENKPASKPPPSSAKTASSSPPSVPLRTAAKAYGNGPSTQATMPYVPDVLPASAQVAVAANAPSEAYAAAESKEPLRVAAYNAKPAAVPAPDNELMEEIRQMKQMMRRMASGQGLEPVLHPILADWKARLAEQDILPVIIDDVIGYVETQRGDIEEPGAAWFEREIASRLAQIVAGRGGQPIDPAVKVIHFVGPTGVGKTTTIAKLAADQVLKAHRKVGLITSDTYRIAAVEQLKTYATILNIPLEVVFSPADLHKAFEQMQTCDLVLMDTAGRNYRNEMYVSELNTLLASRGNSETILVLSLTNKYRDMKVIAENFSKFGVGKVLFTKMDETESCGAILNLLYEYPLQLSYITDGQNVPEDITLLSEPALISRIMGMASG